MNWARALIILGLTCACRHSDKASQAVELHAAGKAPMSIVHQPPRLTGVDVGRNNALGEPIRVRCETCHTLRQDAPLPKQMDALEDFHRGMTLSHGTVECSSCHAQGQPPRLRLASGETIPVSDALRLCSQCHGPQYRDYQHGAHGGMTGYWDTTRGGRVRNHCVDCHDPHTPKIAPVIPLPRPRDRFFNKAEH